MEANDEAEARTQEHSPIATMAQQGAVIKIIQSYIRGPGLGTDLDVFIRMRIWFSTLMSPNKIS